MPRLIHDVIVSEVWRGEGSEFSPGRLVVLYHDADGNLLAEVDPDPAALQREKDRAEAYWDDHHFDWLHRDTQKTS